MTALTASTAVLVVIAWIGTCLWLTGRGIDALDYSTVRGTGLIVAAAFVFLFPIVYAVAADPNSDKLCRSGHEEWRHGAKGSTYKTWVCDSWDEPR